MSSECYFRKFSKQHGIEKVLYSYKITTINNKANHRRVNFSQQSTDYKKLLLLLSIIYKVVTI